MTDLHNKISIIVESVKKRPTIVNPDSKFVVVTYWWGHGNVNNNIARPCISFYEDYINRLINSIVKLFSVLYKQQKLRLNKTELLKHFPGHIIHMPQFKEFINQITNEYFNIMYIDLGYRDNKDPYRFENAVYDLNEMRNSTPPESPKDFVLFDGVMSEQEAKEITRNFFKNISYTIILFLKEDIYTKYDILDKQKTLKTEYELSGIHPDDVATLVNIYKNEYADIIQQMKDKLKIKTVFDVGGKGYVDMNIFDILNEKLRFRSGKKFQEMIQEWEQECQKYNCNYLQIEYPEFTQKGGYQMAINAKPLFIRHALNLCNNRAVLYIDGDMFIRKYPAIFDMDNVDFMARGWNMDPRASYNIGSSIVYDPYKFETSGGIMYYSQSPQSRELLNMWVNESGKERNMGKADDRILSLVFNSKKFLLNMNIIQLPIEYLWLTLDYDDRMLNLEIKDGGYDWDIDAMKDSIIIEHPECLTSEDTAAGAGASINRNPMFHAFLDAEESIDPVSEEFIEYLYFPDRRMVKEFGIYLNYMKDQHYLDDGNLILVDKGFVFPGQPEENNEKPLYITNYNDRYGERNDIADFNIEQIKLLEMNDIIQYFDNEIDIDGHNILVICEKDIMDLDVEIIPLIIYLIDNGKNVVYRPNNCEPNCYIKLLSKRSKFMDLTLFPTTVGENVFKPEIDLSQPIYFSKSSEDSLITKILLMFESLEDFSGYLKYGSFQIISRIRVEYAYRKPQYKDDDYFMNLCDNTLPSDTLSNQEELYDDFLKEITEDDFLRGITDRSQSDERPYSRQDTFVSPEREQRLTKKPKKKTTKKSQKGSGKKLTKKSKKKSKK